MKDRNRAKHKDQKQLSKIVERVKADLHNGKWILLGLLIYWLTTRLLFHEFCATRILTGFPCPGCGMTRAAILMLTGHFAESFRMHPMVLPWAAFAIYFCIYRYIIGEKAKGSFVIAVGLCIVMVVLYINRMVSFFPYQEPMTYKPPMFSLFQLFK